MRLNLSDMIFALSFSLDQAENALLGVDTGHGKRVACLAMFMAREAGVKGEELRDFVSCCILHDNALTEFIHEELAYSTMLQDVNMPQEDAEVPAGPDMNHFHCVVGEKNIALVPFHTDVKNIVLYHHENADGTGPMGKTAAETPLKAQLVRIADYVDVTTRLSTLTEEGFLALRKDIAAQVGTLFSQEVVDLFMKAIDYDKIVYCQKKSALAYLRGEFEPAMRDYSHEDIRNIARLFAEIVDYKSTYTCDHSIGVAEKAEIMGRHYGFDDEKTTRYYFAAAMHDIGKMVTPNIVLEKPGRLTDNEFDTMKDHAATTNYILSHISGIPDIIKWASNHHEKLNGSGYPQGLKAEQLSFEERLMACIDIYQALTETRPYRDSLAHDGAIAIMRDMVEKGELDEDIVRDMDLVLGDMARTGACGTA